jgi:hypothetical protein
MTFMSIQDYFGVIMNFLVFWHYALIISKKIHLPLFELIKDKSCPKGIVV